MALVAKATQERSLADKSLNPQIHDAQGANSGDCQHRGYELLRGLSVADDFLQTVRPLADYVIDLCEYRILINAKATISEHFLVKIIVSLLDLIEHILVAGERAFVARFDDPLLGLVKRRDSLIDLRLEAFEDHVELLNFLDGRLELVDQLLRQVPVMLVVVIVVIDAVLGFAGLTLRFDVVEDALGFSR